MLNDNMWKERLAFVSGNILVLGLLLLKLWPTVSRFQTGMLIHFWTMNLPQEGVRSELWIYWFMTAVLALAGSAVILAIVHILCRGVWLAISIERRQESVPGGRGESLDRICQWTYGAVFLLAVYIGIMLLITPVILASIGFEQFLVSVFSLSIRAAGWVSRVVVLLVLVALIFELAMTTRGRKLLQNVASSGSTLSHRSFFWSGVVFLVVWCIAVETCYTMDLNVNEKIFDQTKGDIIEIYVTLGGATSDADVANLRLLDSHGTQIDTLTMHYMGKGQYLSYIISSTLPEGRYQVMLDYPHESLSSSYPFLRSESRKSQWFLVVP